MKAARTNERPILILATIAALGLVGCDSGPEVDGTQWVADMSTLQWGEAGNSVVQPGDGISITVHGNRMNFTAEWEVTESSGDHATVHVTTPVDYQSFDLEIDGDTMTYSRPSDLGQVTATLTRFTR